MRHRIHIASLLLAFSLSATAQGETRENMTDSMQHVNLPVVNEYGQMPYYGSWHYYPYYTGSYNTWDLHKGLNVNLGFRAMMEFGKNSLSGVGFGENVAMIFADNFKRVPKLSYGVGIYMDNVNWGNSTSRAAGLTAMMGYQLNDNWSTFMYLQKNLVHSNNFRLPWYYHGAEVAKDAIGAAIRYSFSPGTYIQLNIECNKYPSRINDR